MHLLRKKVGDSLFWKAIRIYYKTYAKRNASTSDLQKIFENVTNQNLETFFHQWLFLAGQPMLNIHWSYNNSKKVVILKIEQMQPNLFQFPLEILFRNEKKKEIKTIQIKNRITEKKIPLTIKPTELIFDPDVNMLFEENVLQL